VEVYRRQDAGSDTAEHRIRAPMPGRVVLVQAKPGDAVSAGDVVLVIEAMKMELALKAPRDGVVEEVRVTAGEFVEADAVLATLEQ
ncbi:MAG: acetyl-CoA carboxylase biotin carboxyl carrier protein subunit, partial [Thermomonas sp.]